VRPPLRAALRPDGLFDDAAVLRRGRGLGSHCGAGRRLGADGPAGEAMIRCIALILPSRGTGGARFARARGAGRVWLRRRRVASSGPGRGACRWLDRDALRRFDTDAIPGEQLLTSPGSAGRARASAASATRYAPSMASRRGTPSAPARTATGPSSWPGLEGRGSSPTWASPPWFCTTATRKVSATSPPQGPGRARLCGGSVCGRGDSGPRGSVRRTLQRRRLRPERSRRSRPREPRPL